MYSTAMMRRLLTWPTLNRCCRLITSLQQKGHANLLQGYPRRFLSQQTPIKAALSASRERSIDENSTSIIQGDGNELCLVIENCEYRFHASWLRFSCHCPICRQEHSNQGTIETRSLPEECKLIASKIEGHEVIMHWQGEEEHVGRIPLQFLLEHNYSKQSILEKKQQTAVPTYMTKLSHVKYEDILGSHESYRQFLMKIAEEGCCLVQGTPTDVGSVEKICKQIAPIQRTIYGTVFDVVATPQPINIAYSSVPLGYHMDLMYYESPPGIQVLHCVRFDECVTGGESLLLDSFSVAEELRLQSPEDFRILSTIPATFQKIHFEREFPVSMRYQRPHIVLNHDQEVVAVNWSPSFEGPLCVDESYVDSYYKAYRKFSSIIDKSNHEVQYRLRPGDMLIFNNRRILHARKGFALNGGSRHLQGLYLNIDEFKSQVAVANKLAGIHRLLPKIGNQCFS
ncbi:putative gamma-butyrobetaine dioxygenase [Trichoplax sp. H2]|nr:putative gamma-butyrobetaine dioxygenase [Trichoplax sp. H2]|eukprot:RDD42516.1 putative gamma-butyrobetaine dioxygenase [Trichoplax sp. H2]